MENGQSVRMGSLVTNLDLGDHPLITADELCLVKAGKKCGKCIKASPINAFVRGQHGPDSLLCPFA